MSKFFRYKHVPTGMYYQPQKNRGSHLSSKGKVYNSSNNGIDNTNSEEVYIFCCEGSRIEKLTSHLLAWEKSYSGQLRAKTNKSEWFKEYILES